MTIDLKESPWGLSRSPFGGELSTRLCFEGASHREALARLRYLRTSHRVGWLLGAAGVGKSLVLKLFCHECRRQGQALALVNLAGMSAREFYCQLAVNLGAAVRVEDDLVRQFRDTVDRIAANAWQGIPTVIALDDVHEAGPDVLAQLVRLARLDAGGSTLTIALAARSGTPQLTSALLELADLRIELEPWDELDTVGYLQLALVEAGSTRPLFDDDSLSEIYRLTGGVPREVRRLAEHSLWLGAPTAPEIIDTALVRAAHTELMRARG